MRQNLVVRAPEVSLDALTSGRRAERFRGQVQNGRHQAIERDRLCPLADVDEIARVERQRSAAGFPDAVPVAEARKCALVPVLHYACPCVAECLTVDGLQLRIDGHGVRSSRRLTVEAQI